MTTVFLGSDALRRGGHLPGAHGVRPRASGEPATRSPEWMVAVEYDGDQHRSDRRLYVKDLSRLRMFEHRGWIVVRVVAEDWPFDVIDRDT